MRKVVCLVCAEVGTHLWRCCGRGDPSSRSLVGLALSIALPSMLYWRENLQRLAGRFLNTKPQSDDPGYEVLVWWGETGNVFDDAFYAVAHWKRFPKTIPDKRTGPVQEVAHPSRGKRWYIPTARR